MSGIGRRRFCEAPFGIGRCVNRHWGSPLSTSRHEHAKGGPGFALETWDPPSGGTSWYPSSLDDRHEGGLSILLSKLKLFVSRTLVVASAARYNEFSRSPVACGN